MKGFDCGNVIKIQSGVLRTNCVDCLDRTNVVQSVFARHVLHKQLGNLVPKTCSDAFASFGDPLEYCFRSFWTNNANALSKLYAGTPAQKTDFTKTGKRTKKGIIQDLKFGLQRYFINNFMDGRKKDVIDVFLGKNNGKHLKTQKKFSHVYWFLGFVCGLIGLAYVFAGQVSSGIGFYLSFVVFLAVLIKGNRIFGHIFVENPKID